MKEPNIEIAKKRIWKSLAAKLPERSSSVHVFAVSQLRASQACVKAGSLKRVQSKERLLDILPEPTPVFSFFSRKVWALGSLSVLLGALFVPLMKLSPMASASSENTLETVQGEVYVNGALVSGRVTVQEGDRIETGEGSMAHLMLVDDSRVSLGPSTQVDLVKSFVDPQNKAKTEILLRENKGRLWSQVLNLVSSEAFFELEFPQGEVLVTQKASFDVQVEPGVTTVEVARNLVSLSVQGENSSYQGVLGQGAQLLVGDEVSTNEVSAAEQSDVWWTFNLAYGKSYARGLDASYKKENIGRAIILPGNPLYGLKTFREQLQISFAMTSEAREDLLVEQAQNRLDEAQSLLARGDSEAAAEVLEVYQDTVAQVSDSDNSVLLAQVDETQKQAVLSSDSDDFQLLQDHLSDALATVASDVTEKSEVKMESAAQLLQQVPDLMESASYDRALEILSEYQNQSLSVLSELENIPMDEREAVISKLLDQKLADLQLLRVIAAMPQMKGAVDADSTMMEQMSLMVLSLRQKELGDLSNFFTMHDYEAHVQEDMYDRLKEGAQITPELTERLQNVEEQLQPTTDSSVVIDLEPVLVEDPRFSVSHSDETEDQPDDSE